MRVSAELETRQIALYSLIGAIYGVFILKLLPIGKRRGIPCTHTLVL